MRAKAPAPKKGKVDSTAIYDSLGNKLGTISTSLDSQTGAFNIGLNLQPPNVNASVHEKSDKEGNKKTREDETKSAALHSSNQVDAKNDKMTKDVVRKTDVWAWVKWIAGALALLFVVLNYKRIWAWLLSKIKK